MGKGVKTKRVVLDPPQAPAKLVKGEHVKDRGYRGEDGRLSNNKAWRRLSPLEQAHGKNQLAGGDRSAQDRFAAGVRYAELFAASERSGRDSTQALNVSRGGKPGAGAGHAAADAWDERLAVERSIGARDKMIIRLVCGEGVKVSEAVRQVCGVGYADTTPARFREALDALMDAFAEVDGAQRGRAKKVA